MQKQHLKEIRSKLTIIVLATLMSGCVYQSYTAKPLDISAISTEFRARDQFGQKFQSYLKSQGYVDEQLPPKNWGLSELT